MLRALTWKLSQELDGALDEVSKLSLQMWVSLALAVVATSVFLPYLGHRLQAARGKASHLASELQIVRAAAEQFVEDSEQKRARIAELEQPCFDCCQDPADFAGELGYDFAWKIFNVEQDQATMRFVKIQCPGVCHEDIEVQLIYNGCEVTIRRKASRGVEATTWRKQFSWQPSEGLFEFKEDQMQVEQGFLHLVFKAFNFQSRVIRFPQHFSIDSSDNDMLWEYSAEEAAQLDESSTDLAPMKPDSYLDTESTASTPRKQVCSDD